MRERRLRNVRDAGELDSARASFGGRNNRNPEQRLGGKPMKSTISVIKADVGSIGGHIKPSAKVKQTIEAFAREKGKKLLTDLYSSSTGDDVALLMSHNRGVDDSRIH